MEVDDFYGSSECLMFRLQKKQSCYQLIRIEYFPGH